MEDADLRVVISNSNVKHSLVAGGYAVRRKECEAAVAKMRERFPAIMSLRDVAISDLESAKIEWDPVLFQRARHVISENQRTKELADALVKRDYFHCGNLMYDSHASLRDDYAVSCRELDTLVKIAREVRGVYGARMTGGGFGGCIVALTTVKAANQLIGRITDEYPKIGKRNATSFATVASAGAHIVAPVDVG
jgi:galactokinase